MPEIPISLLLFTYISGISVGTFIFYTIIRLLFPKITISSHVADKSKRSLSSFFAPLSTKISIISLLLLGIGLLASATHLGHPFRFLNAFANPKSMIAQEAYWSIAFGLLLLMIIIYAFRGKEPSLVIYGLTSIVGVGLLIVTSLVYANVMGVPAWNHGITPVLFFVSSIIMGCVVCLFVLALQPDHLETTKKIVIIFTGILIVQILVVAAFSLQLSAATKGVQLPDLLSLNIGRWVIGLIVPLLVAIAVFKKSMKITTGATLLFLTIIVGEGISRFIFFMNGVHF